MKVIVDSDVWSEALRKKGGEPSPERNFLGELITEKRVQLLGCIRQEALQGLRDEAQFERLRAALQAFPERQPSQNEYEMAASFYNLCRSKGIQGSSTDFLICACSAVWGLPILTKDRDFGLYAQHFPLKLVKV